jgi:hypothetical protein
MSLRSRPRGSLLHTCTAVQATGFPRWKMLVPGALESGAWVGLRLRYMLKSTNTVWCFSSGCREALVLWLFAQRYRTPR